MKSNDSIVLMLYVVGIFNIVYAFIGSAPILNIIAGLCSIIVAESEAKLED